MAGETIDLKNTVSRSDITDIPVGLTVAETDFSNDRIMAGVKSGIRTRAWNLIYRRSESFDFYKGFLCRVRMEEVKLLEEARIPVQNWYKHYSFLDGVYVEKDLLSVPALSHIVESEELYEIPGVGPRIFDLTSAVVNYVIDHA